MLLLFPCCRLRGHRGGAQGQAGLAGTLRGLAPRASAPQRGGRRLPSRPGWRPHSLCGPRPGVPGGTREACGAEATLPPRPLGPSVAPTRARGSRGLMGDTWGLMCILCLQGLGPVWVWSPDPDRPQTPRGARWPLGRSDPSPQSTSAPSSTARAEKALEAQPSSVPRGLGATLRGARPQSPTVTTARAKGQLPGVGALTSCATCHCRRCPAPWCRRRGTSPACNTRPR